MPARTPIVVGNWKMNTTRATAVELAKLVAERAKPHTGAVQVGVCPPLVYLEAVCATLCGSGAETLVGAQNAYFENSGAFTGEVSVQMLADIGAQMCIVGHSERRHVLGESDELINKKTLAVLNANLCCILCVGEKIEEREAGETDAVNERQLRTGLAGVTAEQASNLVIAYEPVWAIGTGKTATPDDAQTAHAHIRSVVGDVLGDDAAQSVRIQYGGSMKPANAAELLAMPDIDGGLIGGAALQADTFLPIIEAAAAQVAAA